MVISTFVFWLAAATCNAIMDTVADGPHFRDSIFSRLYVWGRWWGPKDETWVRKWKYNHPEYGRKKWFWGLNYPVQLTDPWHFFKMLMIIFIVLSIIGASNIKINVFQQEWLNWALALITYGVTWNFTFSVFYDKLLKK